MRLDALIRAHGYLRTERPPEIWEADTEDVRLLPLLGELIAAALSPVVALADVTLNVANVEIAEDAEAVADGATRPGRGEYVAITIASAKDRGPDARWLPDCPAVGGELARLDDPLRTAGACFAYLRRFPHGGSVTFLLRRLVPAA